MTFGRNFFCDAGEVFYGYARVGSYSNKPGISCTARVVVGKVRIIVHGESPEECEKLLRRSYESGTDGQDI